MSYFITGFVLNGTTAGLHEPEVVWSRSTACLRALSITSISSAKSYFTETFITVFTANNIRLHIILLPKNNIFCFKINYKARKSRAHFQVGTLHKRVYSSWVKLSKKWPNALPLLNCALLAHSLPAPILTGQKEIKKDYIPALWITLQMRGTCQLFFSAQEWHRQVKWIWQHDLHLCFCRLQQIDSCHLVLESMSSSQNPRTLSRSYFAVACTEGSLFPWKWINGKYTFYNKQSVIICF